MTEGAKTLRDDLDIQSVGQAARAYQDYLNVHAEEWGWYTLSTSARIARMEAMHLAIHTLVPELAQSAKLFAEVERLRAALAEIGSDFEDFPQGDHLEKLGDLAWYSMAIEQQSIARIALKGD